jgi:hypothetical protein
LHFFIIPSKTYTSNKKLSYNLNYLKALNYHSNKYDIFAVFNKAIITNNSFLEKVNGINKMQKNYSEDRKIDPSQGNFLETEHLTTLIV